MNSLFENATATSSSPVPAHTIANHVQFNRDVQVSAMFESSGYREGLARLNLMVEHHYLGVLTGNSRVNPGFLLQYILHPRY